MTSLRIETLIYIVLKGDNQSWDMMESYDRVEIVGYLYKESKIINSFTESWASITINTVHSFHHTIALYENTAVTMLNCYDL